MPANLLASETFPLAFAPIPSDADAYGIKADWYGENGDTFQPNKEKFYAKPIVLLIVSRTFSAEDFAMKLDFMKRGLLVGALTVGSTGQSVSFNLLGGGYTDLNTYPDGKKFIGICILPGTQVSSKTADFISNGDSTLETALREIKTGK